MPTARMPEGFYSTSDVAAAVGASLRQMQWWDEKRVVKARRVGHDRAYTFDQAFEAAVIVDLKRSGGTFQALRELLRPYRRHIHSYAYMVVGAWTQRDWKATRAGQGRTCNEFYARFADTPEEIVELLRGIHRPVIVSAIGAIREDVRRRLEGSTE